MQRAAVVRWVSLRDVLCISCATRGTKQTLTDTANRDDSLRERRGSCGHSNKRQNQSTVMPAREGGAGAATICWCMPLCQGPAKHSPRISSDI